MNTVRSESKVMHVTDATFEDDVLNAPEPVLVDFWAPWCGPCRMIAPVLEELSEKYAGRLKIAKVNVDQDTQHAALLGIRAIPTLVVFRSGEPVEFITGARPRQEFERILDKLLVK